MRLEQEEKAESARQRALAHELEWVRSSPRARQAKSKARLANYERLVARGGRAPRRLGRDPHPARPPRLGDVVVEVDGLTKGYGDRLLMEDLSFTRAAGRHRRRDRRQRRRQDDPLPHDHRRRVARRGAGCTLGETVELAYVDQSRDALDAVHNRLGGGLGRPGRDPARRPRGGQLARLRRLVQLQGADQQKPVGQLSGGERNRVHLAKLLAGGGNLILLDEPTNDLDVDTLRALEEALEAWSGCGMITSHDRWFLDRIATHILAFEGDSQVRWFEGNFAEYAEHRRRTRARRRPARSGSPTAG